MIGIATWVGDRAMVRASAAMVVIRPVLKTASLTYLSLQKSQLGDVHRPPTSKFLRTIERDSVDDRHFVGSSATTKLHEAKRGELSLCGRWIEVPERIDEHRDRPRTFFRFQQFDDTLDLIDLSSVAAETRAVDVRYPVLELGPVPLPPIHQIAEPLVARVVA
ncbi:MULTISPECIES: hypothetical protein [unclassified Bradyrhizobium]|uniref:hypothetical protein n=1 Tax=unclassified Bradyrhizobium TaxID=2631580 RepID=UPI002FF0F599